MLKSMVLLPLTIGVLTMADYTTSQLFNTLYKHLFTFNSFDGHNE